MLKQVLQIYEIYIKNFMSYWYLNIDSFGRIYCFSIFFPPFLSAMPTIDIYTSTVPVYSEL